MEAPAGSGKTGLLLQRFLRLLSEAVTVPEEVLAITFTRKATAELRERLFAQLEAAASEVPIRDAGSAFEQHTRALALAVLQRDRERGWKLLQNPRRVRIQTIDSLSIEIAGTLPLLSGAALRAPIEDASELYHQAARNTLLQLGGTDRQLHDALHTVLLHRDGNLLEVERLVAEMLARREQWAELVPLDRGSLSDEFLDEHVRLRLERTLERIVCAGLSRALEAIPAHVVTELASLAHQLSGDPGYRDGPNPVRFCSDHPGPPAAEAAHLDHWHALIQLVLTGTCEWRKSLASNHLGLTLSKLDKERLSALIGSIQCEPVREALENVRSLPPARYPDDQWRHAKALFRLLLHALAELKLRFAETGECDFTEFSLAARQALDLHAEDVARSSGLALRHLLVDEMQDTSSAQYDLLTALTRSWDGSSQTLFLVGDPKQSIYLFRQARVERFLRTVRDGRLGDVPLRPLQLTANFRSRPEVVAGVNASSERLFLPPGAPLAADVADVPFVQAVATRPAHPGVGVGVQWHTRVLPARPRASEPALIPSQPVDGPGQQDAAAIRRIVEQWRARPLPADRQATADRAAEPWRIAVLGNARSHLAAVAAEFRREDGGRAPIPYRAVRVDSLGDRPEVLDAFALTRALHHPADRGAWFAVLRAPWCGLDAADLLVLAAEGDSAATKSTVPQLVKARASLLSPTGKALLGRAWPTLLQALEGYGSKSLRENVQAAWMTLGGKTSLSPAAQRNVQRFFTLVEADKVSGTVDLQQVRGRLHQLYAEPAAADGAVELSTIHMAKGLEWDVVLVPSLERPGQRDSSRLLNWLELDGAEEPSVLLAPIHGKGDLPGMLYKWLNKVHNRRVEAERKRVFYVACTRAREQLHLFATARLTGRGEKTGLSRASGSLLNACWAAAEPHFAEAAEAVSGWGRPDAAIPHAIEERGAWAEDRSGLALAAAAEESPVLAASPLEGGRYFPRLSRLPLAFDPQQQFREAAARRLPYLAASELPRREASARPEGSMGVRALGTVVHRFLEHMAARLAGQASPAALSEELPGWLDRIVAGMRAEGLAPVEARHEASRALRLLSKTLADPVGAWLLSLHPGAASEQALATSAAGLLRVDRTFRAGNRAGEDGDDTLWVVDFKTTEPGGRDLNDFLTQQRGVYGPQLERYAAALRQQPGNGGGVRLGLYFPAIPQLVCWPAEEPRLS